MKKSEVGALSAAGLAGEALLRPGFGWTPGDDAAFALGFPHLRRLVDGHREDEAPHLSAKRILDAPEAPPRIEWPRRVAQGLVRVWGLPSIWEMTPNTKDFRLDAEEQLWTERPVDASEAGRLLATRMVTDVAGLSERAIQNFVLLLEAQVGTEATARAIVDTLEGFDPDLLLAEWSMAPVITYQLGFLLLRVPPAVDKSLRARLRACLDTTLDYRPVLRRRGFAGLGSSHARSVHLVLNGGAAAEDTDRTLRWYAHVTDDPVLVRMRVALNRLAYVPDARLVFLGGADVLDRYAKDWRKLNGDEQRWFVEQHGRLAAPQVPGLMLDMVAESAVPDAAIAFFTARRERLAGFVEDAAKSQTPRAVPAKKVLKAWEGA